MSVGSAMEKKKEKGGGGDKEGNYHPEVAQL